MSEPHIMEFTLAKIKERTVERRRLLGIELVINPSKRFTIEYEIQRNDTVMEIIDKQEILEAAYRDLHPNLNLVLQDLQKNSEILNRFLKTLRPRLRFRINDDISSHARSCEDCRDKFDWLGAHVFRIDDQPRTQSIEEEFQRIRMEVERDGASRLRVRLPRLQ